MAVLADTDTLRYRLEVTIELLEGLLRLLWLVVDHERCIRLDVVGDDEHGSVGSRRYFNDEERVCRLDEVAALIQHDPFQAQVGSLIDVSLLCLHSRRVSFALLQALVASLLIIVRTERYMSNVVIRHLWVVLLDDVLICLDLVLAAHHHLVVLDLRACLARPDES